MKAVIDGVLHIRGYRAADCEPVWRLHNVGLHAAGAHGGNGPWDDDLRRIEVVYLDDGGEFLVGVCHGRIVAMGALRKTSLERAEIKRMRVEPGLQRRGFGQTILTALDRRAAELGYATLHLDTAVYLEAARGLYEKNGYQEVRRDKVGPFDSVFYEKSDLA